MQGIVWRYLKDHELPEIGVRFKTSTLRKWRLEHKGPPFVKIGSRIFYNERSVQEWLASRPQGGERMAAGVLTSEAVPA